MINEKCDEHDRKKIVPDSVPDNTEIVLEADGDFLFTTAIERESSSIDFSGYFASTELWFTNDVDELIYKVTDDSCGTLAWRITDPENGFAIVDADEANAPFKWTGGNGDQLQFMPVFGQYGILMETL